LSESKVCHKLGDGYEHCKWYPWSKSLQYPAAEVPTRDRYLYSQCSEGQTPNPYLTTFLYSPLAVSMLSAAAGGEAKKIQFLSPDWKLAGWGCSFLADIGNWLAGSGGAVSNTNTLTVHALRSVRSDSRHSSIWERSRDVSELFVFTKRRRSLYVG